MTDNKIPQEVLDRWREEAKSVLLNRKCVSYEDVQINDDGEFHGILAECIFMNVFVVARSTIEIELPYKYPSPKYCQSDFNIAIELCELKIKDQGYRVKEDA